MKVTCPCGTEFDVAPSRYKNGRGKHCSRPCMYKYRAKAAANSGWMKPGHLPNETSFKPGLIPWNKGVPTGFCPASAFQPGHGTGEANHHWAGDDVGYDGLHKRIYKERGKAADYACQRADETCKGPMHWANISGRYESINDFKPMCQSHHFRYDRARERQSD